MKLDQTHNGELKKRQTEVIPKGKRLHWIAPLKLWILIDKKLNREEIKERENAFLSKYIADQTNVLRDMIKHV